MTDSHRYENLAAIIFCFTVLLHTFGFTQTIWTKHPSNPIIPPHDGYTIDPAVIFESAANQYRLWYTARMNGRYHVFYATSDDGVDWSEYSGNPVLSPSLDGAWDGNYIRCSAVIFDGQEYKLYYMGSTTGFDDQIGLATSQDGINWQKHAGNPIITIGSSGEWDAARVYHPKVLFDGSHYFMWYAGYDGTMMRAGLATSTDGVNWSKHSSNPVIDTGATGSWDDNGVWPNSGVILKDGTFYLLYTAASSQNNTVGRMGLATSNDGVVWTKYQNNPILWNGSSSAWDREGLGSSMLLFHEDKYKLWYSAHTQTTRDWQIGYAESAPNKSNGYALEFDGFEDLVTVKDTNTSLDLNDFTIEAWINRAELNSHGTIISKGAHGENASANTNFALAVLENNVARVLWENAGSQNFEVHGTTVIEPNRWYHLAGVRDASKNTLTLYVNGEVDAAVLTTTGIPNIQDVDVLFGYNDFGFPAENRFKGAIDEVRIWNIARTQTEIQASLTKLLNGSEAELAGYWRFDEDGGQTAHDSSPFANDGYLGNTVAVENEDPLWIPSYLQFTESDSQDYALSLDGLDDIVQIDDANNSLDVNAFTLEAWVYRSELDDPGVIIHKGAWGEDEIVNTNFALFIREDNLAHVIWERQDSQNFELAGSTLIEPNQWYHIAGVRSATDNTLKVFVNGLLDAEPLATTGVPNIQDIPVLFGFNATGFPEDRHFTGLINEIRIWNIPRTQAEIQTTMFAPLTGAEAGLVGYWRLDEGVGQIAHDLSPNANHGSLGKTPSQESSDPRWVLAASREGRCAGIPLPAAEAFGRINGGDTTHVDQVAYCFASQGEDQFLSFQAWDIDTSEEVDVLLNGTKVFEVPLTANNSWSGVLGLLLPKTLIDKNGQNELIFDNTKNPPKKWKWGVRQVSAEPFYALPSTRAFGNIHDGNREHPDKVVYFFTGQAGDHHLKYKVYDIDDVNEVDIILNGAKVHDVDTTQNNTWSTNRILLLPDDLVNDAGINVLIFENTQNPPREWFWGVRKVRVELISNSTTALALAQNSTITGSMIQGAEYLFDGQTSPLARPDGDDVAPPDSARVEGATTIEPDGELLIEFASVQRFDHLALHPEWNPERYSTYLIEASLDGQQWQTLVDKSEALTHGAQIDSLPATEAKFLRISGASYLQDVGLLHLENLAEEIFWQEHDEFIKQAEPTALAIAELALLQKEPSTNVAEQPASLPTHFSLAQNFPNPFNPSTTIRFDLPISSEVKLQIYNVRGQLIRDLVSRKMPAGHHKVTFDATGLASGIYFYRLQAGDYVARRKMVVAR